MLTILEGTQTKTDLKSQIQTWIDRLVVVVASRDTVLLLVETTIIAIPLALT